MRLAAARHTTRVFLLPLLLLLSSVAFAQPRLQPGEYLRSDYMRDIEKTRKPHASAKIEEVQLVIVAAHPEGVMLIEIYSFHEGGASLLLLPSGEVRMNESAGEKLSDIHVEVLSETAFNFTSPGCKTARFECVGSAEEWVARQTVVGSYKDEQGRPCEFGADGTATLPDRTFSFRVSLDPIGPPNGDYLYNCDEDWAYDLQGETLRLFRISESYEVDSKPAYVLHRVKTPRKTDTARPAPDS
jgi:hypothetical protein